MCLFCCLSNNLLLQNRLREADSQSQDLNDQMHRLELEKRELNSRFGVLYSTLKRFIRVLEDTHQGNNSSNKSFDPVGTGVRFMQPLSNTMGITAINHQSDYCIS